MLNHQFITIGLIGIFVTGSVSGFFTVVCQGYDGHVALEPAVHNHCRSDHDEQVAVPQACSAFQTGRTHQHCSDTLAVPGAVFPKSEKKSLSRHQAAIDLPFNGNASSALFTAHPCRRPALEPLPFHLPLRAIVLQV